MIRNTITLSESKAKLELRFTISYLERTELKLVLPGTSPPASPAKNVKTTKTEKIYIKTIKMYRMILENDIHVSI